MKQFLAAALLLAAAPAAAQSIETAGGDWSNIPEMRQTAGVTIDPHAIGVIMDMVERRECAIAGQRRGSVDLNLSFLVLFKPDGAIDRLVLSPFGCARAEGVLAGALLHLVQAGGFQPVGGRREGWFRGEIGFTHSGG